MKTRKLTIGHRSVDMRAIFYSGDGLVWYWGRYTREEIALLKISGWRVVYDTWRFRQQLS